MAKDYNATLIEFVEHEGFDVFYKKKLDKEILRVEQSILSPNIEEEDRVYTKVQVERRVLEYLNKLRQEPLNALRALTMSSDQELSSYGANREKKKQ